GLVGSDGEGDAHDLTLRVDEAGPGVAFAIAPDKPNVAYALDIEELQGVLAGNLSQAVDTGPCL
ncbi:MAG: hypothetical protein ACO1PW_09710, partial [Actinomycetota bacterium]